MTIQDLGDRALTCDAGSLDHAVALSAALRRTAPPAVVEIVPAFSLVTVEYDLSRLDAAGLEPLRHWLRTTAAEDLGPPPPARRFDIPVTYAGQDLPDVARAANLTPLEVIALHSSADYRVAAIGFLPGFAYLTGLPAPLRLPRRATPRTRVPAGTVAIGGPYSGVYPVDTPGGWHLLGTTHTHNLPAFAVGDRVRFIPRQAP
jgi:KipI family sensor histidine kinase inhibitor